MPWFRFRRRKDDEQAAQAVAPPEAPPQAEERTPVEGAGAQDDTPTAESGTAAKRRRRGSRGGRNRRKPAVTTADDDDGTAVETVVEPGEKQKRPGERAERGDRSSRRGTQRSSGRERRRQTQRRQPLPDAKRELLITVDVGEQRVALLEDDRVAEVYLERPERRSIAGNIYLGTVDNVLPGMEAAFVEIGLEKNGFLYVDEIVGPELEGRKGARKIQDLIKRGQTVLVQAVKDPMKSKGARLTTELSLPGRFLVYVPNGEGMGVSRRLDDQERTRLKEIVRELDAKGGGIIVRTAAEGASAEDIERDLVFLQRLWKTIEAKAEQSTAPELVYEEAELPLRIVRDLFAGDFVGAQIDDDRTHRRIVSYLKKTSPHMIERVHRYRDKTPLFEASGVEQEIRSTLARRVDLPSGGYLVFDYAEAFTVIDVNTGRFVGSRGKSSGGRLEDTIVKNNLEAVKEVVRQLRLRDIGGIIVIDFIDMANPKNRSTVEDALRTELERDRTKTFVVEISPLGLVEMTRQNVTDGPREILTTKCAVCAGDGFVVSEATHALEIERKLREVAKGSRVQAFRIGVHPRVLALLAGPGGRRLQDVEALSRRRFFLVPAASENGHVHLDHFEVLDQGKLEALQPTAPVAEGASLELKLVEVGLYDASAGVGKVDGAEIVVSGAAKLVGKKVSVTVGRVLDGVAYASLADAAELATPITFEAEAEKPTRAPSRRKETAKDVVTATAPEAEADIGFEAEVEDDEADEPEEVVAVSDDPGDGEEQPKKKRTRRGTRGGRGRKKPAPATAVTAESEVVEQEAVARKSTPRIHVPVPEPAAEAESEPEPEAELQAEVDPSADGDATPDGQPKRKRSRRGTRGGRKRKKPATNGIVGDAEPTETEAEAEVAVAVAVAEEPPAEYVPMSEWIEDFDSRSRGR